MLGTYHGSIYNRGSLRIVEPDGTERIFPFQNTGSAKCKPSPTPSCRGQATEDHLKASGCNFPADSIVACYGGEAGSQTGTVHDPRRTKVVTGAAIFGAGDVLAATMQTRLSYSKPPVQSLDTAATADSEKKLPTTRGL